MNRNITILLIGISILIFSFNSTQSYFAEDEKYIHLADSVLALMTLEEKIGQLNLPAGGDITTGQATSTDLGQKIKDGKTGGLFNLKGVEKIREAQRIAVEESRLGIPLILSLEEGKITEAQIDAACRRILVAKFQLGLFDDPYKYCDTERANTQIFTADNRSFAREVSAQSFVLLKNDNQTLPLKKKAPLHLSARWLITVKIWQVLGVWPDVSMNRFL